MPPPVSYVFLAVALLSGLLGGYILTSPTQKTELCPFPFDTPVSSHVVEPILQDHHPEGSLLVSDDLDLDGLRAIVSTTRGYYARDYSLGLGWNNMRYIIETAVHHGVLLNRTVIIPTYIYARACEFENAVCAAYTPMINRGDAINSDEWRQLPEEQQMGWKVPMSVMLNITHIRRFHPVITVAEYLRLHDLPEDFELRNGQWDTQKYHQNPSVYDTHPPSLHVIRNDWYDPYGLNRVDALSDEMKARGQWGPSFGKPENDQPGGWPSLSKTGAYSALERELPEGRHHTIEFNRARDILRSNGVQGITSDEELARFLESNGWEVLYTFEGALGMDYVKNVVNPIKQVAPRNSIRGFVDDYYHITEDVLLLKGEIHYERKPAGLRFTSTSARDTFARLVLFQVRHTDTVTGLAVTMARRMQELVGGRMWMGAHMRRGDFVRYNWVMQAEFGDHLQRIKDRLDTGRDVLHFISSQSLGTYDVPDAVANPEYVEDQPPHKGDLIYIATDERDPGNLAYLREHGVVRAPDLITVDDRRRFGWPLLITDVLGIVEQELLAQAAFFYAHALSSVAGGVVNVRAASGADPRTAKID